MNAKHNRSHVITLTLSSLLGLGAAIGAASAARAEAAPSVTVSYRDLDLSQPADVRTLYRRLERAASNVCGPVIESGMWEHTAWNRCYQQALDSAVMQIRSPELLALYRSTREGAGG